MFAVFYCNPILHSQLGKGLPIGDSEEQTRSLAAKMGGVTILRKGHVDVISNGVKGQYV